MAESVSPNTEPGSLIAVWQALRAFIRSSGPTVALCITGVSLLWLKDLYNMLLEPPVYRQFLSGLGILTLSFLHIYGTYQNSKKSKRADVLERENDQLREVIIKSQGDHRENCSRKLLSLAEQLQFDGNDRISLYKYEHDKFIMLGRHAERPDLRKPGRGVYSADQGVIGGAWKSGNGSCFVDDLSDPADDLENYINENSVRFQVSREITIGMSMKSRTIAAFCLKDHGGLGRAAVIVFESLAVNRFKEEQLRSIIEGAAGRELSLLLDVLKPFEPSLDLAKGKGF